MADGNYNCGIFIDIFPLFGIECGRLRLLKQKFFIYLWKSAIAGYEIKRMAKKSDWKLKIMKYFHPYVLLWNFLGLFTDHVGVSKRMMKACSSAKNYEQIGLLSFSFFEKRFIWNKEWFDELVIMPFEFTDIACPKDYDPILRTTYGNYMKFVKGCQVHTMVLCDSSTPFKMKMSENFI
jgi:lipopolysaccharide cholinephosphotransferase